jgi:hypothetical protein
VCILFALEGVFSYGSDMPIPDIVSNTNTTPYYTEIAENPLYSYPIKLNGEHCWPSTLSYCLSAPSDNSHCCRELYSKDSHIFSTISVLALALIVIILMFAYLIIRVLIHRYVAINISQHVNIHRYCWYKILWDSILGFAFSLVFTLVSTDYLKLAVSAPRPIYQALMIYSSVHSSERAGYEGTLFIYTYTVNQSTNLTIISILYRILDEATLSFPSGHASCAMGGLLYLTLICLSDIYPHRNINSIWPFFFTLTALVPFVVSAYIYIYIYIYCHLSHTCDC